MPISDTDFDAWLLRAADGLEQAVVLCDLDFAYEGTVLGTSSNVALASAGATVSASTSHSSGLWPPSFAIDGDVTGTDGTRYWNDGTLQDFPDTLTVTFASAQTIDRVVVYSLQDAYLSPVTPTDSMVGIKFVLQDFTLQAYVSGSWTTVATVRGNNLIKRTARFTAVTATAVRINITKTADANWSRIVELQAWTVGGAQPSIGTARLSRGTYITEPSDSPASTSYLDCIASVPQFARRLDVQKLGGRSQNTVGDLVINNADGALDFLRNVIVDGQEAPFYIGDETWARSDFRQIFTAVAQRVEDTARGELTVRLRDRGLLLDVAVIGSTIGGTGINADKSAPVQLGTASQVEALQVDSSTLLYRYADAQHFYWFWYQLTGITDVRDNGVSLAVGSISGTSATIVCSAVADTFTYTAHGFTDDIVVYFLSSGTTPMTTPQINLSGPVWDGLPGAQLYQYWVVNATANTFQLALTRGGTPIDITNGAFTDTLTIVGNGWYDKMDGSMWLSNAPAGKITVSSANCGFGALVGGSVPARATEFFRYAARYLGGLPNSQYQGPHGSFVSGNDLDAPLAFSKAERFNLADLLDEIAFSSHGFWSFTRLGKFTFGRLQPHDVAGLGLTSQASFTDDDLIEADARVARLEPLYSSVSAYVGRNYPPLDYVASSVASDVAEAMRRVGYVEQTPARDSSDYDTTPERYHASMTASPTFETLIATRSSTAYSAEWVDYMRAKFLPHVEVLIFTAPFTAYDLELGDQVTVNMTSLGHTADTYWQVAGHDVSPTELTVGLTLVRRRVPSTDGIGATEGSGGGGGGGGTVAGWIYMPQTIGSDWVFDPQSS